MRPVRPTSTKLPRQGSRDRRVERVVQARRRLGALPRGGGRAWINGREVGGSDPRYRHLGDIHD